MRFTDEEREWLSNFNRYIYRGSKAALEKICDDPEKVAELMKERVQDQNRKRSDVWAKNTRAGKYDSVEDRNYISAVMGYCPRCEDSAKNCKCSKPVKPRGYTMDDYTKSPFESYVGEYEEPAPVQRAKLAIAVGYINYPGHRLHNFMVKIVNYREATGEHLCQVLKGVTPTETRRYEYLKIYLTSDKIKARMQ